MPCVAKGTETRLLSSQNHKPVALKVLYLVYTRSRLPNTVLTPKDFLHRRPFTPNSYTKKFLLYIRSCLRQTAFAPEGFLPPEAVYFTFMPKKKLGTRRSTKGHAKQTALSVPLLSNSVLRYNRPNDRFSSKNGPLIKIGTVWNDMHTVIENRM